VPETGYSTTDPAQLPAIKEIVVDFTLPELVAAVAEFLESDEQELATAIRDGRLDVRAEEVLPVLRVLGRDRPGLAHPGYAMSAIADRLFAALEAGDVGAVAATWSEDVTVWHIGAPRPRDKARALRVIHWFVSATNDRHYDVLDRQLFDGGFVQQHILHGDCRDGRQYSMRVAMIILVGAGGLITRIDEYFDPATLAPLQAQQVPSVRK
jgi:ketosteroid isomerase-like protein